MKTYKNNVELLVEYFQLVIVETARQVFGFKKFCQDSVNWVDKKVHKILKKKKKISNKISHLDSKFKRRYGSIAETPSYQRKIIKKKKKKLRKLQKRLKKKKYRNIIQSTENIERLINNSNINQEKLFYNMVNKISNRQSHTIPPLRNVNTDEIIAQTDMEIANKLHEHYCTKLKRNKYKQRHRLFHNYVESVIENYQVNRNKEHDIVNRKFTEQEVMHVLTTINIQSAMGFDYIHYQLLYWARFVILSCLTLLFNLVFFIHQIWKYGEYVPVPKPGRVSYYCKNIRPISILPGLGRIIGKLHCNRLLSDCIKRKLLSKYNCAFQCNRGPDDIYNNLTESILQALQNGHFFEMSFEDLKSAYDSVWIEGLIYRMINEYKYDGNIIAWYLSFFENRYTRVKYNGKKTKWRKALKNLPQGQTDSTILFVLFLNNVDLINIHELAEKLKLCVKDENDEYDMKNESNETNHYVVKTILDEINDHIKNKIIKSNDGKKGKIKRPKFMDIKTFQIIFMNFADDCALAMKPMKSICDLTNKIKFKYRWNLQGGITNFFEFTRFYQLVIAKSKCSTVSFSRKKYFHAYVYKLDGNNLDLIHSHQNGPQECIHNEKTQYLNPFKEWKEGNSDSDLDNLDNDGEKIIHSEKLEAIDPKNKMFQIRKTGKQAKLQSNSINKLPDSVRILGVYFDPEMYFNDHIKIVTRKVEKRLHCLLKLAHCKYYKFKPYVIYKLFETVIRPKLEYALCTVGDQVRLREIQKIQKRAMRIALQVRKQTPSWMLMETVNGKTIDEKLKELQIKMWHKYKRAPKYLLQSETFKQWKEYIVRNDDSCMDKNGILTINPAKFNYVSKSPLSRAYNS